MTEYTSVKLPKTLANIIRECKTFNEYGYRSVSDFVISVSRRVAQDGKY